MASGTGDSWFAWQNIGWKGFEILTRSRDRWQNIGWKGFEILTWPIGDGRLPGLPTLRPRLISRKGSLLYMFPSVLHICIAERFGMLVMEVTSGLNIPCMPMASAMFHRQDLGLGIQGDKVFYLANEFRVRGKLAIDLTVKPPPDLAIEVEITHPAPAAIEVYQALRVPEIWVYNHEAESLRFLRRQADGYYEKVPISGVLPFLASHEVLDWIQRPPAVAESQWLRQLRDWVRDTLAPRLASGG